MIHIWAALWFVFSTVTASMRAAADELDDSLLANVAHMQQLLLPFILMSGLLVLYCFA